MIEGNLVLMNYRESMMVSLLYFQRRPVIPEGFFPMLCLLILSFDEYLHIHKKCPAFGLSETDDLDMFFMALLMVKA